MSEPELRERVMKLETLVGSDAGDGLRGDMKSIKDTLAAMQARIYLAIGGGAALLGAVQLLIAWGKH